MAVVTPTPLFMNDAQLTLGVNEVTAAVSSVTLTPSTSTVVFKGLTPGAIYQAVTTATWTADIVFAQDHDNADSISRYLLANEGDTVAAVFEPKNGGSSFAVSVMLTPSAIGGGVDTFATATVSLPVVGKPVITPAA